MVTASWARWSFVGHTCVGCFGARHRRLFRVYDRTVRVLNGFIGVGIDTEQYVFVAGIIAIFYSVDYRAVAGGEGDKASLLACIYLVPFFIGIYIIYRVVDTFIGGISIGDDEISYGISCREFGGDITVFVLIQKLYFCIPLYRSGRLGILVTTSSGIWVVSCNGCIRMIMNLSTLSGLLGTSLVL